MANFETELKTAYDRWTAARGTAEEDEAAKAYRDLEETVEDDACVVSGEIHHEHDYGEYECRRCGAEAPYDEDDEET